MKFFESGDKLDVWQSEHPGCCNKRTLQLFLSVCSRYINTCCSWRWAGCWFCRWTENDEEGVGRFSQKYWNDHPHFQPARRLKKKTLPALQISWTWRFAKWSKSPPSPLLATSEPVCWLGLYLSGKSQVLLSKYPQRPRKSSSPLQPQTGSIK